MKRTDGHEVLRGRLQSELVRRCKENPRYSMRAFARSLQMDFSTLSKILQGHRKLGPRATGRIARKLGLKPDEIQSLVAPLAGTKRPGNDDYSQVASDAFEVISDWHHFAILELMRVEGFRPDAKWIAACLGISLAETRDALARLQRLGMLVIHGTDGKWIDASAPKTTVITPELTSAAQKKLQKQILEKSIAALSEEPISVRDHTAMTMAIDPSKLPDAKERIKKFRRSLSKFLSRGRPCTEVYHLNVSLYPVTRIHERKY
jgi:transcriptional regulator with XRE-family HTH domain